MVERIDYQIEKYIFVEVNETPHMAQQQWDQHCYVPVRVAKGGAWLASSVN